MKNAFFPGCSLKTPARGFEETAISCARVLDLELIEIPRWNCCGTVYSLTTDDLMHYLAPIRNLIRAQKMAASGAVDDQRLVTLCSMCYNTLKRSSLLVEENPDKLKVINNFMDEEESYSAKVEVVHFLQLMREIGFRQLESKVKKPLRNLRVSPYYGCMLLRPRELAIDDPEDPKVLEDFLEALGAHVVDNPLKVRCCGSYLTANRKQTVADLAHDILTHAVSEGADALAVSCPLCAFNLDARQAEVKNLHPSFEFVPIFYFTQLMALAFGLDPEQFGFDTHTVDPRKLLKEKGLLDGE